MNVATTIDPEIAAALAVLPFSSIDFGSWTLETIPTMRAAMAGMPIPEPPPTTTVSRDVVLPPGRDGHAASARVYAPPRAGAGRPCILWIHGGGYMFGSGLMTDPRLNRWVEEFDCVVVSAEYRLAPEHPYPGPLDDCYAALTWTAANSTELGIDPSRIVVAGASAGGGLAAALVLLARDRREVPVAFQLLIYPMIDDRNLTPSSHIVGAPVWSREANLLGWRAYLGREPGGSDVPIYAAPARAGDLATMPPTWIGVGTLDVFRDENIDYAKRLLAAGIPVELHVYPGATHGFELMAPDAAVARRCQRDIDEALGRALGGAPGSRSRPDRGATS
ncbi:MAG TPA: alpha/beta hydrolase [Candidatus Bathyarchaeia archaeon]|nr:alpha/beta hydrolase [Candidatus Bathyarchaeia archaeon]